MQPYSMDLRQRVLEDSDGGMNTSAVAKKYKVSPSWVRRLKQRRRQSGEIAPRPPRNHHKPKLQDHQARLAELVARQPEATIPQLIEQLGLAVSPATLWRALRDLRLSVKKKPSTPANRTGPT